MTAGMRVKAEDGVYNFISYAVAHSGMKQTCTVHVKAEGETKKVLPRNFLLNSEVSRKVLGQASSEDCRSSNTKLWGTSLGDKDVCKLFEIWLLLHL